MTSQPSIRLFLGTHAFDENAKDFDASFPDPKTAFQSLLAAFQKRGYNDLDTAANYPPGNPGASEILLGKLDAVSDFIIQTKVLSGQAGMHKPARIADSITKSLSSLQTDHLGTYFLHVPDRETPFEETLKAMNEAHKVGQFKDLGISNYSPAEVAHLLAICEEKGYVKPSVYQGHYNVITRGAEAELFPLLRKSGIAFQAYSPAAGGLFSPTRSTSLRWQPDSPIGQIYNFMYSKPEILSAVDAVIKAAAEHNISSHAAVLRWLMYHSKLDGRYGDGIVFSVSKVAQLDGTIDTFEGGPLPGELVQVMNGVYEKVKEVEPPFWM